MDASERFLRFAAECELMANHAGSREQTVWRRLAENGCDVLNWSSGNTR